MSSTWSKTIIINIYAILWSSEIPNPIDIVVSKAFLNIWPFTNQAYNEIARKISSIEFSSVKTYMVAMLANKATRAWTPRVPEETWVYREAYKFGVPLLLSFIPRHSFINISVTSI